MSINVPDMVKATVTDISVGDGETTLRVVMDTRDMLRAVYTERGPVGHRIRVSIVVDPIDEEAGG